MNAEACLADRVKLICQDDAGHVAESFMKQDEFDRLGLAYICLLYTSEYINTSSERRDLK